MTYFENQKGFFEVSLTIQYRNDSVCTLKLTPFSVTDMNYPHGFSVKPLAPWNFIKAWDSELTFTLKKYFALV